MGYENSNTTPKTKLDEIMKSGVEELVPILSENEQAENDINQEEEEVDLEEISQIQDIVLREKLLSITRLISNIESLNDNPIPDHELNSSVSILIFEESDNFLSDNFSPEFETFCDHTEETTRDVHFLEELLIDESILSHESSDSNFKDNPSIPRPPPEPPDDETDAGEEISVVMNDKEKFDEDCYFFMFVMVFSFFSAESEDTIFDPVYDDFEDIEYVEASLSDPEIVSVEEKNVVQQAENDINQEEEEVDLEEISQIQDIVLREKL
nr:hypothetical protein [Tanacetum cinerariifolium]